ncbi:MAG: cytochrome c [Pseudomonadota bacterium]
MRRVLIVIILLVVLGGLGVGGWLLTGPHLAERQIANLSGDAARGESVLRLGGCVACHTDIKNEGPLLAGGPGIKTEFGTFYAPNITPHAEDGIGSWSAQDFANAMTTGVGPQGTHYYPVFPYDSYALMTDQDLADLWAHLQTIEPITGAAPANEVNFPFSVRPVLAAWQTLFVQSGPYTPDPDHDEAWNRGAYIVNGPGHCVACHTPRNAFGARDTARHLDGSSSGPDGEKIPPITREALADAGYNESDIVFALTTTITPEGDSLGGSMGEVIGESMEYLSQDDLNAIATYLMSEK